MVSQLIIQKIFLSFILLFNFQTNIRKSRFWFFDILFFSSSRLFDSRLFFNPTFFLLPTQPSVWLAVLTAIVLLLARFEILFLTSFLDTTFWLFLTLFDALFQVDLFMFFLSSIIKYIICLFTRSLSFVMIRTFHNDTFIDTL